MRSNRFNPVGNTGTNSVDDRPTKEGSIPCRIIADAPYTTEDNLPTSLASWMVSMTRFSDINADSSRNDCLAPKQRSMGSRSLRDGSSRVPPCRNDEGRMIRTSSYEPNAALSIPNSTSGNVNVCGTDNGDQIAVVVAVCALIAFDVVEFVAANIAPETVRQRLMLPVCRM